MKNISSNRHINIASKRGLCGDWSWRCVFPPLLIPSHRILLLLQVELAHSLAGVYEGKERGDRLKNRVFLGLVILVKMSFK